MYIFPRVRKVSFVLTIRKTEASCLKFPQLFHQGAFGPRKGISRTDAKQMNLLYKRCTDNGGGGGGVVVPAGVCFEERLLLNLFSRY